MPRAPRIQFAGARYHIITRGDGRRALFHDQRHYERFTAGLSQEVQRSGWIVLAYCWMPNHIHALIQTPEPNLAAGMQRWLSGYANWYAKRNQRTGHLYQGRYKAFLVEDAGYFWTLSRYTHLNPCRGSKPLVQQPEQWPHSSFPGYLRKSQRQSWVAYDQLHASWRAENGGSDPDRAYVKFVKDGLRAEEEDPFQSQLRKWVFGSEDFLKRMIAIAAGKDPQRHQATSRRLKSVSIAEILKAVAAEHDVQVEDYAKFRSSAAGRDMAAWLCRKWTGASLTELGPYFGLAGVDSVTNLVRRAEKQLADSKQWQLTVKRIEQAIGLNTENKA